MVFSIPGFGAGAVLRLGSATESGNYYKLAQSIKELLQKNNFRLDVRVVTTQGSTDNIRRIENKELDLAIVQNDIAFFAENGMQPFERPARKLSAMMAFYPEPIYVLTNNPNIHYLRQLENRRVNVGPFSSGLIEDAKIILKTAGIWDTVVKTHYEPAEASEKLVAGNIEAVFVNGINERNRERLEEGKIFAISLPEQFIEVISSTFPHFKRFVSDSLGDVNAVAVTSILVATRDLDPTIAYELVKLLHENHDSLQFPADAIVPPDAVAKSIPLANWNQGASQYFKEKGLLPKGDYYSYLWMALVIVMLGILFVLLLSVYIFYVNERILEHFSSKSIALKTVKLVSINIVRHKYLLLATLITTVYLTCIFLIKYYEHGWALENNIVSAFDAQPFWKNLLWLFVFGGSGHDDNIFPQSTSGKFLVTLIPIIGFGGVIGLVGMMTSDQLKKHILEARGMNNKKVTNHILICGWNENVPFMVTNLLHENIFEHRPIVILADINEEVPLKKHGIENDMVHYVKGDATNREDLDRANMRGATTAVVVADENSSEQDAKTILRVLAIESYCRELEESGERRNRENIYTIAEIKDVKNYQIAYDACVDRIVSLGHIETKIFVQAVNNPGISKFIDEILTYNEFNDVYSFVIQNNSRLLGRTFDELLRMLREYRILLLSINVGWKKTTKEIEEIKRKNGLKREIITNPFETSEIEYETVEGDVLIVLSQYEKNVKNAIKSIEKERKSQEI